VTGQGAAQRGSYRPCAGIMLFNRDGRVFVAQRIDTPEESWQMPQGGIDRGESPRDAAFRELGEEIGTAKAEFIAESARWLTYDWPEALAGRLWHGRFRGQRLKWFALRFTGDDRDINLDTAEPEFRAWKWVAIDELPALIIAFKRAVYEDVVAEFRHLAG
jgi:putative (di)nucleoside polyphosphate hydrolase